MAGILWLLLAMSLLSQSSFLMLTQASFVEIRKAPNLVLIKTGNPRLALLKSLPYIDCNPEKMFSHIL